MQLDASMSNDPDSDSLCYAWDFGDGSNGEGMRVSYVYGEPPTIITATLTVTDSKGASHESSVELSITKRYTLP
ncbi:MAG: PKD domain-containing protein [Deinococcota bacterium]